MTTQLASNGIVFPNNSVWVSGDEVDRIVSSTSYDTAAVLTKKGKLIVWASANNNNADGIGGTGNYRHTPMAVPFPDTETGYIVDAQVKNLLGWALFSTGNLYTWGDNSVGACGAGATNPVRSPYLALTNVAEVYKQIGGGYSQNMVTLHVRKTDNTYWCTGYNAAGRLGVGDATNRTTFTQITAFAAGTVRYIWPLDTGYTGVTFVQKTDDTIWACGWNYSGCIGNGNSTQQNSFINVTTAWGSVASDGISVVKVVGSGTYGNGTAPVNGGTVALLKSNGELWTCGNGASGQIGNGTLNSYTTPQKIANAGSGITELYCSSGGTASAFYYRMSNGTLKSWGYNGQGQMGNGTTTSVSTPFTLSTTCAAVLTKEAGNDHYSYMNSFLWRENDGTVKGTGVNQYSQLACSYPILDTAQKNSPVLSPALYGMQEVTVNGYGQGEWMMGIREVTRIDSGVTYKKKELVRWGYNGRYNIDHYNGTTIVYVPMTKNFD